MKKIAIFFICIIGIALAVFAGNLLFMEYQEFKLKVELEKEIKQKNIEEDRIAQQLATQNLKFGKPIIQESDNWYIEIKNTSSGDVFGSFIVEFLDKNGEIVLEETIYLDVFMVKPYDNYFYNGYISSEKAKQVTDYKIKENGLFYYN